MRGEVGTVKQILMVLVQICPNIHQKGICVLAITGLLEESSVQLFWPWRSKPCENLFQKEMEEQIIENAKENPKTPFRCVQACQPASTR